MSQKSSLVQFPKSVSQALTADIREAEIALSAPEPAKSGFCDQSGRHRLG
jgi:hypothetical protein